MDVCGENAVCITTKTGYECLCPEGSVGNPDMKCYFKIQILLCMYDVIDKIYCSYVNNAPINFDIITKQET